MSTSWLIGDVMSGARIVHLRADNLHREPSLRRIGFHVDECSSLVELVIALKTRADPVTIGAVGAQLVPCAIAIVRGMAMRAYRSLLCVLDDCRQAVNLPIEPCPARMTIIHECCGCRK